MAIKAFYATEDEAPEPLREHLIAAESGDGYVLDIEVEDFRAHPQAAGLKSALDKERQSRRELERRAKELETGEPLTDPDRLELEEWRRKGPELETRATAAEKAASDMKVDGVVERAIAEHGGISKVLRPLLRLEHVMLDDEGHVAVKGPDGNPRVSKDGDLMTVSDLVGEMSKDPEMSHFFASKMRAGSGTPPGNRTPPSSTPAEPSTPGRPAGFTTRTERENEARRAKIDRFRQAQQ